MRLQSTLTWQSWKTNLTSLCELPVPPELAVRLKPLLQRGYFHHTIESQGLVGSSARSDWLGHR